ncbi:hypothetical protein UFOVP582_25 [uncultured Caudovirales phage]|uniref:Uncharacterized protein n=1 Tax=uncultured Caudovirales phage TaxID=2100421 RepID=A0A6J7XFL8_9CAUD|nr:hypothetical protein UFOVP582_25 [uncultured Caudovirales phage]CAB4184035.1 hypothetical protein UFOVP1099_29 [uncultured Caudovirales phage]CAB4214401.1 hypothetical protein UFOVP1460_34 [uncultured Caudovirales phage]CAB5228856.1 hypothetical protein UFOVP1548_47 [uncultured Caudovirales phage]
MKKKSLKDTKTQKVMHEWKSGTLHSGSKKGPVVKDIKQAIAIAMSESHQTKVSKKPKSMKRAKTVD